MEPSKVFEQKFEERAEVVNLTRNIRIGTNGDIDDLNSSQIGGHIMIMASAKAFVRSVQLNNMGQAGVMGRYPFHWHQGGNVSGQYFKNSSIVNSYQRCVTIHGTNNAQVNNNICYNHKGHGFFLEDGNEVGNKIQNNVSIFARKPDSNKALLDSDINSKSPTRFAPTAAFWISNPKNTVTGNVAASYEGSGFWMAFVPYLFCDSNGCEHRDSSSGANVFPAYEKTTLFENNVAHSGRVGFTWDGAPVGTLSGINDTDRVVDSSHYYGDGSIPTFKNLMAYKNLDTGIYFRGNTAQFTNVKVGDNSLNLWYAFNQRTNNSLIVGESVNITAAERLYRKDNTLHKPEKIRGFVTYDGPAEFKNIVFGGFPENKLKTTDGVEVTPVPIHSFGGNTHYVHEFEQIQFTNNPYYIVLYDPDTVTAEDFKNHTRIRDLDGTLYGRQGELIVPDQPIMNHPTCRVLDGGRALALGCHYEMATLHMGPLVAQNGQDKKKLNFQARRIASDSSEEVYPRQGGDPDNWKLNFKLGLILDEGYRYLINYDKSITKDPGFFMQFKYPNAHSAVISVNSHKYCTVAGAAKLTSFNAVQNYTGTQNVYYQHSNGITHIKLYGNRYYDKHNTYRSNDVILRNCQ